MTAEQFLDSIWQLTGDAPKKFDAPVVRQEGSSGNATLGVAGKWIWGPLENGTVPGGQQVLLRKRFEVPVGTVEAKAVVSCDNEFDLYLNGQLVGQGDNYLAPEQVDLADHLVVGENTLVAIARNGLDTPNPAGFFLQAWLNLVDQTQVTIQTDESWTYSPNVPDKPSIASLSNESGRPATVLASLAVWNQAVAPAVGQLSSKMKAAMNQGESDAEGPSMVRASLLKNSALMKSLGRPMREQIVSMRPDTITTLEAIDLANEPTLAASFAAGAKRLIASTDGDVDSMIRTLFQSTLAREPTPRERVLFVDLLGTDPSPTAVQDAIWAICMLPEYMLIR
jgi:hypothetical protein